MTGTETPSSFLAVFVKSCPIEIVRVAAIFAAALYQRLKADRAPLPTFDIDAEAHARDASAESPLSEAWREWRGIFEDEEEAAAEVGERFAYLVAKRATLALSDRSDIRVPEDAAGVRDLLDALDTAECG